MRTTQSLSVLIVEDHPIVAETFRTFLIGHDFTVQGIVNTVEEAEAIYRRQRADLVLCDVFLAGPTSGVELPGRLLAVDPRARVVMLSAENDPRTVQQAFDNGAVGYIAKTARSDELMRTIADALAGQTGLADSGTYRKLIEGLRSAPASRSTFGLTRRELEVLSAMVGGVTTTKGLARKLFIAESSVRTHVDSLRTKLDVHTRAELVAKAVSSGIDLPE